MSFTDDAAIRRLQSNAVSLLFKLLTEDLPVATWGVSDVLDLEGGTGELDGQLSHDSGDSEALEGMVNQWAGYLRVTPLWDPDGDGGRLHAVGEVGGVKVEVWAYLGQPPMRHYPPLYPDDL
ncbi:hypothetical protein ETD86_36320 [Nonomuraea turkmeniaca]|uniref:Uncharacterized protein n=1 Tax=Nonomuraea turkmeniaca TaxID=103838 RepID=A0A5S4F502_9ACTN|nr:hypothetical protein [Nonomuraea turkmeniaca]TMR11252.1 hypothetical protein ETD86_36320 [Nonomuraea turkmeniaca]